MGAEASEQRTEGRSFGARARSCAALALLAVLGTSSRALADYPIASHRYLADPAALVHGGRVYLYASNDDDNAEAGDYTMHSFVCVSSSDLKNWTDHGIVFQVPADASWAQNSWAPQPIERDGTIYLYFGNSASGVGVASSTDPLGEFKDAKGGYLVDSSTPGAQGTSSWLFDPGALIDDDGTAYLSFGGNGETNARIIKLGSDLKSVSGSAVSLAPTGFFEASYLFKRDGTYYFAYSSDSSHGLRIDYMTSKSPMSGYEYAGTIADQPPVNNNNNHASEFEFEGKWYHAYHNRYVSTQAGISTTYKRNLALEALEFNADGTIQEVTYTTDGVKQVGSLDPYVRVEGETMHAQSGIETERLDAGGMTVTSIDDGDWIALRGVDFGSAGAKSFSASVASTKSGGSIELRLSSATGTLVGTCSVPSTGGAKTYMTTSCDVSGATGLNDLYLKFKGSGSSLFNLDYWQFAGGDGGSGMAGAAGTGGVAAGGAAGTGAAAGGGGGRGGAVSAGGSGEMATGAGGVAQAAGGGGTSPLAGASGTAPSGAGGMPAMSSGGSTSSGGVPSSAGGVASAGTGFAGQSAGAGTPAAGDGSGCGCRVGASAAGAPEGLAGGSLLLAMSLLHRRRQPRRRR
jgi:arabinoxylan arabinofuranohydrolase